MNITEMDPTIGQRAPIEERIQRSILVDDNGCWLWQLCKDIHGYGQIQHMGHSRGAHRVSYEVHVGPVPDGLVLDHLCRVRACCNPDHLEAVTNAENIRRGMAPSMVTHRTGVCRNGHAITEHNVYVSPKGDRECRECRRIAGRRYDARRRAPAKAPRSTPTLTINKEMKR